MSPSTRCSRARRRRSASVGCAGWRDRGLAVGSTGVASRARIHSPRRSRSGSSASSAARRGLASAQRRAGARARRARAGSRRDRAARRATCAARWTRPPRRAVFFRRDRLERDERPLRGRQRVAGLGRRPPSRRSVAKAWSARAIWSRSGSSSRFAAAEVARDLLRQGLGAVVAGVPVARGLTARARRSPPGRPAATRRARRAARRPPLRSRRGPARAPDRAARRRRVRLGLGARAAAPRGRRRPRPDRAASSPLESARFARASAASGATAAWAAMDAAARRHSVGDSDGREGVLDRPRVRRLPRREQAPRDGDVPPDERLAVGEQALPRGGHGVGPEDPQAVVVAVRRAPAAVSSAARSMRRAARRREGSDPVEASAIHSRASSRRAAMASASGPSATPERRWAARSRAPPGPARPRCRALARADIAMRRAMATKVSASAAMSRASTRRPSSRCSGPERQGRGQLEERRPCSRRARASRGRRPAPPAAPRARPATSASGCSPSSGPGPVLGGGPGERRHRLAPGGARSVGGSGRLVELEQTARVEGRVAH